MFLREDNCSGSKDNVLEITRQFEDLVCSCRGTYSDGVCGRRWDKRSGLPEQSTRCLAVCPDLSCSAMILSLYTCMSPSPSGQLVIFNTQLLSFHKFPTSIALLSAHMYCNIYQDIGQQLASFSVKEQIVNILGVAGHTVSVASMQLGCYRVYAPQMVSE